MNKGKQNKKHKGVRTEAWLLTGFVAGKSEMEIPGILQLSTGRLSFVVDTSLGPTLADAKHGTRLFDIPLSEVRDITFPWYYFGFGFKFKSGKTNYRVNFAGPVFSHWGQAARDGKAWKAVLQTNKAAPNGENNVV